MARPDLSRVPDFYHGYINLVDNDDLCKSMKEQTINFISFLEGIPTSKQEYRYADGKWSLKELLLHINDAERIFAYRALCFARKDNTPLPSFDENKYADNSKADNRDWQGLIEEFKAIRKSNEIMFSSFDEEQMESTGNASGKSNYVRAIGYTMVGHINHHVKVIKEKYL